MVNKSGESWHPFPVCDLTGKKFFLSLNMILAVGLSLLLFFSHPVVSDSFWPHGMQHARPLCPSPSPKVCPSSCPSHRWCHPAISSSDALFSFCPQSFPASGTFPMSQMFASDNQNTGVSTSASVLTMSMQGWFSLRLMCFDHLAVQGTLRSLLQHHSLKASILQPSAFFTIRLSQPHVTTYVGLSYMVFIMWGLFICEVYYVKFAIVTLLSVVLNHIQILNFVKCFFLYLLRCSHNFYSLIC